jgi:hypothetical protein
MANKTFTLEEIEDAMENYEGFCIRCGEIWDNCEPDARKYHCDACNCDAVYGAEEIVIMGLVK